MRAVLLLFTSLTAALASERIFGGSLTTVAQYPQAAAVLGSDNFVFFYHQCGGTILNAVAILTTADCTRRNDAERLRVRVGSSFANSGGTVHSVQRAISHPNYNANTRDNNIAILRLASFITFSNFVQAGAFAGMSYNVADNQPVVAIGWGLNEYGYRGGQLHHVQINTMNHERCKQIYYDRNLVLDNMICAHTEQHGLGGCTGDDGGPLLHNNVVIGVQSFQWSCSLAEEPGVYTRVSRYTDWIISNA